MVKFFPELLQAVSPKSEFLRIVGEKFSAARMPFV